MTSAWTRRPVICTSPTAAISAFKSSTGAEIRFFMPVLNVPFRLIFAMNPGRGNVLDNNLQPEKIRQYEIVWEGRLTPEVLISLSPYRLHMTGLIKQQTDGVTGITRYWNLNNVTSQGVELKADYRRSDGLWSYASYSRQDAREDGVGMLNAAANLAKAGISTPTSSSLQGALELVYESGRKSLAGNDTPGVILTDLAPRTTFKACIPQQIASTGIRRSSAARASARSKSWRRRGRNLQLGCGSSPKWLGSDFDTAST